MCFMLCFSEVQIYLLYRERKMEQTNRVKLEDVQENIRHIVDFLVPYLPLANAHASDFITLDHWNCLLPSNIQESLLALSDAELKNLPLEGKASSNHSRVDLTLSTGVDSRCLPKESSKSMSEGEPGTLKSLSCTDVKHDEKHTNGDRSISDHRLPWANNTVQEFCVEAYHCSLETSSLTVSSDKLLDRFGGKDDDVFVSTFMNKKKSHEVEVMSRTCATLARATNCQLVVDFGSGKGYLGNHLYLQYNLPVLGIDAAATNTAAATRRMNILEKQWDGLTRLQEQATRNETLTKKERKQLKKDKSSGKLSSKTKNGTSNTGNRESNQTTEHCDATLSCYVPVTTYIDSSTDFIELAKSNFPEMFAHLEGLNSVKFLESKQSVPDILKENMIQKEFDKLCLQGNIASGRGCESNDTNSTSVEVQNAPVCDKNTSSAYQTDEGCKNNHTSIINDGKNFSCDSDIGHSRVEVLDTLQSIELVHSSKTLPSDRQHDTNTGHCHDRNTSSDDRHFTESEGYITGHCHERYTSASDGHVAESESDAGSDTVCDTARHCQVQEIGILLTGLHTCGNLAPTTLDLFVQNPQIQTVCSVGCCYHLLREQFLSKDGEYCHANKEQEYGFPMSQFLKDREISLGDSARNLASQSVHRVAEFEELQGRRFYRRALLGALVDQVCTTEEVTWKGLRGLEQKCSSTQEYLGRACHKLGIQHKVDGELIEEYINKYKGCEQRLAAFFQLRVVLAPCIEALILLDRVCFLLEQNVTEVYLVKLFDPTVSPRCYGIVATKIGKDSA